MVRPALLRCHVAVRIVDIADNVRAVSAFRAKSGKKRYRACAAVRDYRTALLSGRKQMHLHKIKVGLRLCSEDELPY